MTLNPFGTFGTGYDVGSYGTASPFTPRRTGSGSRSHSSEASLGGAGAMGASEGEGVGDPDGVWGMATPSAIPQFSYKLKASRRVDFKNESLNAVRYLWTFYFKQTSFVIAETSQENPVYFYPFAGEGIHTYNVKLRAYNADGAYEDITMQIEVEDLAPDCDFTYIVSGTLVRFTDISTNIDSDSPYWSFGDFESSIENNPHHTYDGNGTYTVKLVKGSFNRTQFIVIDAEVLLSCDAASGATGYKWERSPDGVDNWIEFADTEDESVGVTEAIHGIDSTVVNYFRVKAYNTGGDSDYSNIANVRCN
jgi:plastocyanin